LVFADSNDEVDLLFGKGVDSFNLAEYEQAISYFDQVLEIDPNNIEALISKGLSLSQLNKESRAIKIFDKALEIDPNNIEALIGKGISLNQKNRGLDAMNYFAKVLKIDPDYDIIKRIPHEIFYSLFVKIDGHAEIMVYD